MRFYDVPGGAEQLPVVSCGGRARLYYNRNTEPKWPPLPFERGRV